MIDTSFLAGKREPEHDRWLYFAPPQFRKLPPEHQDQFYFLDDASTKAVYDSVNNVDILCGDDGWGNTPFSDGCYESVERYELHGKCDNELKKWLCHRGVPFKSDVLLLPEFKAESTPALLTTWKMVMKYNDEFFTSDNLVIVPPLTWCLYFHHDGILHFACDRSFFKKDNGPRIN